MRTQERAILYHPADEELSALICDAYDAGALARKEIRRFIWNACSFSWAATLHDYSKLAGTVVEEYLVPTAENLKNFIYDKATGLLFVNFMPGYHTAMMAHLEALARTPGWGENLGEESWFYTDFSSDPLNSSSDLADAWVLSKRGFFLSSVGKERRLVAAKNYPWTKDELHFFGDMPRDEIVP